MLFVVLAAGAAALYGLWSLGRAAENTEPVPMEKRGNLASKSQRLATTRRALDMLVASPEYQQWRRKAERRADRNASVLEAKAVQLAATSLAVAAALLLSVSFDAKAGLDSPLRIGLLVWTVVCCDQALHATLLSAALFAWHLVCGASFGGGFAAVVVLYFAKAAVVEELGLNSTTPLRQVLEAYETCDYEQIITNSLSFPRVAEDQAAGGESDAAECDDW